MSSRYVGNGNRPTDTIVIGIGGPSGAGKSTLATALLSRLGDLGAVRIPMDAYYRDLSHLSPRERDQVDFDRPEALELRRLEGHLDQLRKGMSIRLPRYDFKSHTRVGHEIVDPAPVVIVEGVFALVAPEVLSALDLAVFIDVPDTLCLERRLRRDFGERRRSLESVIRQFESHVLPCSTQVVRPSRKHADCYLDGRQDLEANVGQIARRLEQRVFVPDRRWSRLLERLGTVA